MIESISPISLTSPTIVGAAFSSSRPSIQDSIYSLASIPNLNNLFFKKKPYLLGFCFAVLALILPSLFKPILKKWQNKTQPPLIHPLSPKTPSSLEIPRSETTRPSAQSFLLGLKQQPKKNVIPFFAQKLLNYRYNEPMKKQVVKEFFKDYLGKLDDEEQWSLLVQLIPRVIQASSNKEELIRKIQGIIDAFEASEPNDK